MKAVGALGTIKYGFSIILTVLLIILFGVMPAAVGVQMVLEEAQEGVILVALGALVIYAGSLGLLYKVIADAVATGNKAAPTEEDLSTVESYLGKIEKKLDELAEDSEKENETSKE
ncbi:MAG: hypothetical protein R6V35_05365 [Candidatus Nanohaloarchaea archaeon]